MNHEDLKRKVLRVPTANTCPVCKTPEAGLWTAYSAAEKAAGRNAHYYLICSRWEITPGVSLITDICYNCGVLFTRREQSEAL
jgi:hypothetical protein